MTKQNPLLIASLLVMLFSTIGLFINVFFVFPLMVSFVSMQLSGQKGGKR